MAPSILSALAELDPELHAEVRRRARTRKYAKGEHLFHEADPGRTMHVIESGLVAIRRTTPLGDETTFTVLGPGSSFGELALLRPGQERTASAVAIATTRTLEIHADDFEELRTHQPQVERVLTAALAETIDRLSRQLVDANYVPVDKRLARRLLDAAHAFGGPHDGTEVALKQDDIASLVGTTRQTVNKLLNEMEEHGLVALQRGCVILADIAALERRAR